MRTASLLAALLFEQRLHLASPWCVSGEPPTGSKSFTQSIRRIDLLEDLMDRDEALKKSDEALRSLGDSLKAGKSEQLMMYLDALSRFHQYSFGNCMLIYMQKPEATHVAGFNRWNELHRWVKKGEKGIAILAPLIRRKRKEDAEQTTSDKPKGDSDQPEKVLYGFRVVYVFDVSQTDGKELPEFAALDGDPGEHLDRLMELYREKGISSTGWTICHTAPMDVRQVARFALSNSLHPAQKFSTMVHELAHEMLHWNETRENLSKTVRETEAEAAAYVVCKSIGLSCSTRASDYIQIWQGDEKTLLQSLETIRTIAAGILTHLNAASTPKEEAANVA